MTRVSLEKVITQKKLESLLDVSPMTIYLWRKFEGDPLPIRSIPTEGGRHKNYFLLDEVKDWLERNRPTLIKKLTEGGSNNGSVKSCRNSRDFPAFIERISA